MCLTKCTVLLDQIVYNLAPSPLASIYAAIAVILSYLLQCTLPLYSKLAIHTAIAVILGGFPLNNLTYLPKQDILTNTAVILERKVSEFSLEIAKAVRFHRKQADLSQQQLAEYASIGKTAVFDIEHGKETVRLQTLLKVLNILNIKLIIAAPLNYEETSNENS